MIARLLFLFVVVPLIELTLLLVLADVTDWRITLLLVLITGLVGTFLARVQGFRTYRRIQQELSTGRMPTDSLLDAMMIFMAGALLLTPGMLTDALGLSLLIPPCRYFYRRLATNWISSRFDVQVSGMGGEHEAMLDADWGSVQSGSRVIDSRVVDDESSTSSADDSPSESDSPRGDG